MWKTEGLWPEIKFHKIISGTMYKSNYNLASRARGQSLQWVPIIKVLVGNNADL